MNTCTRCNQPMKLLFTSWYCDCDKKPSRFDADLSKDIVRFNKLNSLPTQNNINVIQSGDIITDSIHQYKVIEVNRQDGVCKVQALGQEPFRSLFIITAEGLQNFTLVPQTNVCTGKLTKRNGTINENLTAKDLYEAHKNLGEEVRKVRDQIFVDTFKSDDLNQLQKHVNEIYFQLCISREEDPFEAIQEYKNIIRGQQREIEDLKTIITKLKNKLQI